MKKLFAIILFGTATMGLATLASAATPEAKATYKAAKESADAEYKTAHAKCKPMSGNAKDVCVEEAKAARTHTKAQAEADYKNTVSARTSAGKKIAEADYDVAKAKCGSRTGNEKDVCIKEAKATRETVIAEGKANKKIVNARTEVRDEKRDADYKVALEKCDSLSGTTKDSCVTSAKSKFGK